MATDESKTCGTCRHRGKPITKYDYEKNKSVDTGYFLCDRIRHGNRDIRYEDIPRGEYAAVIDGSGYHAALCVESDFGCTLWEAKKP
jgi:hypothetical protein